MAGLVSRYGERMMVNGGKEPFIRLTINENKEDSLKAIERFLQIASAERKVN